MTKRSGEFTRLGDVSGLRAFLDALAGARRPEPPCSLCGCGSWSQGEQHPNHPTLCGACGRAREREKEQAAFLLEFCPPRFRGADLNGYRCPPGDRRARDAVRAWSLDSGRSLFLVGQPGTGKSHLLYAAARRAFTSAARPSVGGGHVARVLARLRQASATTSKEDADRVVDELAGLDLLALDDLGAERRTDFAVEKLTEIVDRRYAEWSPMLISSNLEIDQLAERIGGEDGARIASRLAEVCDVIRLQCADYRRTGGAQ